MNKVILEVRCNEYAMRNRNPHVPWSPEELGADAAACEDAGAAFYHYHARAPETGAPRHGPAANAAATEAIRENSGLIVMPTLGAHTLRDPAARIQHIVELAPKPDAAPDLAPIDLASANLASYHGERGFSSEGEVYVNSVADLRQQIARIREAGVRIHAVLWNVGSARLLGALIEQGDLPEFLSIEIVLSDVVPACHPESERGLDAILDFLPRADLPWFALCAGGNILPMIEPVIERGGHLSFGLGDWPYPELGQPTNAELTRAVAKRAKELGVETAGPREARSILGLAS